MKYKKIILGLLTMCTTITSLNALDSWTTGAYTNNVNISQTLTIPDAKELIVNISGETEKNYDFIVIKDSNGNALKRLSGKINESFIVSGSFITANLKSDYSITKSGVTVSIETKEENKNDKFIPLPKTGQTTTYTNYDDGDYQKGTTRSYTRDDINEIVTDNVTGLMWQDTKEAQSTSWQDSIDLCEALELGAFTDWRLPTIEELFYLTDKGQINIAVDTKFKNIKPHQYWSSTTYSWWSSSKWYINFGKGDIHAGNNAMERHVRCVRLPSVASDFTRDDTLEIVKDLTTGLIWQDDYAHTSIEDTWQEAINYCEHMTFAGYSNWRLPNINELYSIVDTSKDEPAIKDTFINVDNGNHWSSTTSVNKHDAAWSVNFYYGGTNGIYTKDNEMHIRCVKDTQ